MRRKGSTIAEEIMRDIRRAERGKKKLQYIKCLHRLQKELSQYRLYTQKEVI